MRVRIPNGVIRPFLIVAVIGGLLSGACALEKLDRQDLVGPSETGLSVQLIAFPDVVNADGVSQAVVEMVLRDAAATLCRGGRSCSARRRRFRARRAGRRPRRSASRNANSSTIGLKPRSTPKPDSQYVGPVQSGIVMATNTDGATRVFWVAGTDHNTTIVIGVRVYGLGDAARGFLQTVQIFQQ